MATWLPADGVPDAFDKYSAALSDADRAQDKLKLADLEKQIATQYRLNDSRAKALATVLMQFKKKPPAESDDSGKAPETAEPESQKPRQ